MKTFSKSYTKNKNEDKEMKWESATHIHTLHNLRILFSLSLLG